MLSLCNWAGCSRESTEQPPDGKRFVPDDYDQPRYFVAAVAWGDPPVRPRLGRSAFEMESFKQADGSLVAAAGRW